MTLSQFLTHTRQSTASFAALAGLSPGGLGKIRSGERMPGRDAIISIAFASNGAVLPHDWFPELAGFYHADEAGK